MTKATFAGGCFWCTEAIFQMIKGVSKITPGYTGGTIDNPTYEEVSSGRTGHAEAVQIEYNENIVSYDTLLDIFFATHNPTTLNRQGYDIGTQYRSAIFYENDSQKKEAENKITSLNNSGIYKSKIVTDLEPLTNFYEAEDYHKNYYQNNPNKPYCKLIIDPKIKKLLKNYQKNLKNDLDS